MKSFCKKIFFVLAFLLIPLTGVHAFSLNQSTITVPAGQTMYVGTTANGNMSLSNSNSDVASAALSGSQISIYGNKAGSTTITLCVTGDGCQSVVATVPAAITAANTQTNSAISFSSGTSLSLLGGASQSVVVSGGTGSFSLLSNSNPNVAGASVVGNTIYILANTAGGANLSICDQANQCAVLYVSVSSTSIAANIPPYILSFSANSMNGRGSFLNSGSSLLISFNTNVPLRNASVSVGSGIYQVSGTSTGPFTVNYSVTGNEPTPLPIALSITDLSGNSNSLKFSLGGAAAVATPPTITPVSTPVSTSAAVDTSYKFTKALYAGQTNDEVLALQKRLTAEGVYSGPLTGFYGDKTTAAVKKYQAAHNLSQLGSVGPGTRAALNAGK